MNIQAPSPMDSAAFLAWAEGREGRYELANGRVTMMTGGSVGHALVIRGLAKTLDRRLAGSRWIVLTSDLAVKISPETVRYPDVLVQPRGAKLRDLSATEPVLIAEVLSPSSVTNDLGDKAAEYRQITSVSTYLVLSQDEPKAWVWTRDKSVASTGPTVVEGKDGIVSILALSIELPLSEIYEDFAEPDAQN
jgi:Uma2 family endonuclease